MPTPGVSGVLLRKPVPRMRCRLKLQGAGRAQAAENRAMPALKPTASAWLPGSDGTLDRLREAAATCHTCGRYRSGCQMPTMVAARGSRCCRTVAARRRDRCGPISSQDAKALAGSVMGYQQYPEGLWFQSRP
jgi:hypothetical protein